MKRTIDRQSSQQGCRWGRGYISETVYYVMAFPLCLRENSACQEAVPTLLQSCTKRVQTPIIVYDYPPVISSSLCENIAHIISASFDFKIFFNSRAFAYLPVDVGVPHNAYFSSKSCHNRQAVRSMDVWVPLRAFPMTLPRWKVNRQQSAEKHFFDVNGLDNHIRQNPGMVWGFQHTLTLFTIYGIVLVCRKRKVVVPVGSVM